MGYIDLETAVAAANYDPLPVVLTQAQGVWLTDTEGRRYLDMMSAYSAVSLGHGHPRILAALTRAGRAPRRHLAAPTTATCSAPSCERLVRRRPASTRRCR